MTNFAFSFSCNFMGGNALQRPPKHLVMGDLNNNRKLDPVEQQRMQFIDRNGNGRVDPQEHQWEMQNFDQNGNNRLDPNELLNELNTAAQLKQPGAQNRPPKHLVMGDLNNDKKLDNLEKKRMQIVDRNANGRIDPQEHQWEMQNFDANRNNHLDPNEFKNEIQAFSPFNNSNNPMGQMMNMFSNMMSNVFSSFSGNITNFAMSFSGIFS